MGEESDAQRATEVTILVRKWWTGYLNGGVFSLKLCSIHCSQLPPGYMQKCLAKLLEL